MAKRIKFQTKSEAKRASNALRDFHVEHILMPYKSIVVLNRLYEETCMALDEAKIKFHTRNTRGYEMKVIVALNKKSGDYFYYQPTREATCPVCGKSFKTTVNEQKYCSKSCRVAARNQRRVKKNEKDD